MNFVKYSCTGNDFIIIDSRADHFKLSNEQIIKVCSRRTGIGADGIILLSNSENNDFKMKIINSDASVAEMCGNGLRGISHFAYHFLKLPMNKLYKVETQNSVYDAQVDGDNVLIKMTEVYDENKYDLSFIDIDKKYYINTGVPHVVLFVASLDRVHVKELGSQIRYNKVFPEGTNVNFVQVKDYQTQHLLVRTYERGVEDETLACGTGNMACAIAAAKHFGFKDKIIVETKGGAVQVELKDTGHWYAGPAIPIYTGIIDERAYR